MIQELLGVGVVEDGKIPFPAVAARGVVANLGVASASSCAASANSTSTAPPPSVASAASSAASSSTTSTTAEQQNLRCPRCDSTNTKFCYYNNYNLTQPRHFCKTCRRYWTQGGALRNVPIGGGCRKAKSTAISLGSGKSIKAAKPSPSDVVVTAGKSSTGFAAATGMGTTSSFGFDHDLPTSSPILWSVPHNSHLLSLLRAAQSPGAIINTSSTHSNPSPNPNPAPLRNAAINPAMIKEEGTLMVGSHLVPKPSLLINALNSRNINGGEDLLGQVPIGPCNSLWRGSHYQHQLLQHQQQTQQSVQHHNNPLVGENNPSSGIQELIQRMRSTNSNHYAEVLGNMGGSSSSSSVSFSADAAASTANNILVEAAAGGGEFGCWNSSAPFAWADMPNINGAFL